MHQFPIMVLIVMMALGIGWVFNHFSPQRKNTAKYLSSSFCEQTPSFIVEITELSEGG